MNVLVTGAAGYVGSICAEVLLQCGYAVSALDNLFEGHRQAVPPRAQFWACDLRDRESLNRLFGAHPVDAVMHFAAESLVERSFRETSGFYSTNLAGDINLLDAMVRHGFKKLIFSSTGAVYGEPDHSPISEEHSKVPINPYGRTKRLFEQVLEDYHAHAGLQCACLRYFNMAGATSERGRDHRNETHLIPRLLDVALGKREHVEVNGNDYPTPDGTCIRDYVHVLDNPEAYVLALDQLQQVTGRTFNVGNNQGYSVMEVIDMTRRHQIGLGMEAVKSCRLFAYR
jgi:UDP-glucose 4-epimerase